MATKVIVLGQEPNGEKKKPIEFKKYLTSDGKIMELLLSNPSGWKNIELICSKLNSDGYDLMFAYDDNRNSGRVYLGNFNDGVVE